MDYWNIVERIDKHAWLVPLFPLLGSFIAGIGLISFRKATNSLRSGFSIINILLLTISFVISVLILWHHYFQPANYQREFLWVNSENFNLSVGYLVDPLASMMLVIVTSVAILVMIYSHGYMSYDQGYVRFFAYLSLFTTSMLGLILSPNLIQIYVFWELVGMCSYLLIGFWFTRPAAAAACQKAFITNRVGDFGLFLGILGFYWLTGSFEFSVIDERLSQLLQLQRIHPIWPTLFALLIFLGPVAKSAQFPLHVWLPDAMEGPTPISALIHAATMVAAGVFLVARALPIFEQLPIVMTIISWIGAFTAFLAATIAVSQIDLKKGLAYSTMSQLGYMIMAMGFGASQAGLFHLMTHAYSKALLFLASGCVIHGMEDLVGFNPEKNQNMLYMGGLRKYMPVTAAAFLVGTLSLCGIPPFSCFWSKDAILSTAWSTNPVIGIIAWATAGLTSFYMFRIYLLTFEGDFRSCPSPNNDTESQETIFPHEPGISMLLPLIILMVPTIFIGFVGAPPKEYIFSFLEASNFDFLSTEEFEWQEFLFTASTSIGISIVGISSAFILHKRSLLQTSPADAEGKGNAPWSLAWQSSLSGWYVDNFYQSVFLATHRKLAALALSMDQFLVDGLVNFTGFFTLFFGEALRYLENGRAQSYIWVIVAVILSFTLIGQSIS
nr:subunit 5 of NADH-plastoquinone oxidoreductase [Streptofilum sp. BC4-VF8pt]WKT08707.1 subunit 5 of NADH-plastoquinone oxidoreductase [Streptofilum sp. ZNP2-VF4pt]